MVLRDRRRPGHRAEFLLTRSATAWLTMAVQAGFVPGTLFSRLLNLADVLNARRLFARMRPRGRRQCCNTVRYDAFAIIALRAADRLRARLRLSARHEDRGRMVPDRRGTALGIVVGALPSDRRSHICSPGAPGRCRGAA